MRSISYVASKPPTVNSVQSIIQEDTGLDKPVISFLGLFMIDYTRFDNRFSTFCGKLQIIVK